MEFYHNYHNKKYKMYKLAFPFYLNYLIKIKFNRSLISLVNGMN